MKNSFIAALMATLGLCACAPRTSAPALLSEEAFRAESGGRQISLYTLHAGDIYLQATNFGGRVITLFTPDRNGTLADIETGYESISRYLDNPGERFLGAAVGPVANRIGKGRFTLDGTTYQLTLNNNGNTLHGGASGVDMLVWDVEQHTDSTLVLTLDRPDALDGFPGPLHIRMTYSLNSLNEFRVDYTATCEKPTPVNLSHHSFFNLTGRSDKSILGHEVQIFADRTTPVDSLLIPTGEIASLDGSPLDFRQVHTIGERIAQDNEQLRFGGGYDHNWILVPEDGIRLAARIREPESGRVMEIYTDQPALQFYSGNFFDGSYTDKYGVPIDYRCSMAFETQKYPDSINHEGFTDTVLRPSQVYTHTCIYKFGTD